MRNWKTSLGGVLLSIGTTISETNTGKIKFIGIGIACIGGLLVGFSAKDKNVSGVGEEQKTKKEIQEGNIPNLEKLVTRTDLSPGLAP